MALSLISSAFAYDQPMPVQYTGDGSDLSPPLEWSGAPEGTKSYTLIIDDPDAPDPAAPRMIWAHWVVYNLPATSSALVEGVAVLPSGARLGVNDWDKAAYGGPAPPVGRHRYMHKLYALDMILPLRGHPTKAQVEAAMQGHVLAQTVLIGTYARKR